MECKKELKKLDELRKYTKDKYHFCVSTNLEKNEWKLYRRYIDQDVYFSKDNKAIMTSETNTIEELEKYLKEHYEPSFWDVVNKASLYIMAVLWVLYIAVLIIFKKSTYFSGFLLGGLVINLVYLVISARLNQRHYDVVFLELLEESNKLDKRIQENKKALQEQLEELDQEKEIEEEEEENNDENK